MNIIIPLGPESAWPEYNELRYTLRSIEKYMPNVNHVLIVGRKPTWLNTKAVQHIPHHANTNGPKDADMLEKLLMGADWLQSQMETLFVKFCDDTTLLKPYSGETQRTDWHDGPLSNMPHSDTAWYQRLRNTENYLKEKGIERPLNFETHTPQIYSCNEVVFYGQKDKDLLINSHIKNNLSIQPREVTKAIRLALITPLTYAEISHHAKGKQFLHYNDQGLNRHLKRFLEAKFPSKSKYEI